jgi:LCP family protein required for cell wall assembly
MESVILDGTLPTIEVTEATIPVAEDDHVINILLIGTDDNGKNFSTNARGDSCILFSVNAQGDHPVISLVSFERGMGVPILEGEYEGQYDWLTHTFRYGGADLVCRTVEECFRVEIDHYVRVNFTTVTTVVDAIGGVGIYLTDAEAQYIGTFTPNIKPGYNWLDGKNALTYARLREIDSDWSRVERQRKVILAAVDSLKNASLTQLNNLLDTVLPLIQTDMSMLEITELMLYSPNFLKSEFDQMTIPKHGTYGGMIGLQGRNLFAVDFEVNSQILKDFLYGDGE